MALLPSLCVTFRVARGMARRMTRGVAFLSQLFLNPPPSRFKELLGQVSRRNHCCTSNHIQDCHRKYSTYHYQRLSRRRLFEKIPLLSDEDEFSRRAA